MVQVLSNLFYIHALVGLIVLYMNLHFSGNDGYVAFQVEGNPVPTVEWFKVGLASNFINLRGYTLKNLLECWYCF